MLHFLLSPSLTYGLLGSSLWSADREREDLSLFIADSVQYAGTIQKWKLHHYILPFWDISWKTVVKGNPPNEQNFKQCPGLFTLLETINDKICNYWFMVVADGLAGWSGTWKAYDWKIADKQIWGGGIWIEFCEWTKNINEFVSHVNAHQMWPQQKKVLIVK